MPGVYNNFTQSIEFSEDGDGFLDTEMYLTNQGLNKVWYQKNLAQADDEQWRLYIELLYSAVYDLQGVQLNQWLVRKLIQHSEMSSADNITNNLLTEHYVTTEQAG